MLEKKEEKFDIGVIVGRFQVHKPHDAHKELIATVLSKHSRVLLFLGISPVRSTFNNPLDFKSREIMLNEYFKDIKLEVYYIEDHQSDITWSKNLDDQIRKWINPFQTVKLYGSRDSFINRYHGKYPTEELVTKIYTSGSHVRKEIRNNYKCTEDFRAGIIAAAGNRYPIAYQTVDIAVLNQNNTEILLVKKPMETKWRLIGGFSDTKSNSLEIDARREVTEEVNVSIDNITYIGSTIINDWRYKNEIDVIKTALFMATYIFGRPEGGDDVQEAGWFNLKYISDNLENMIVSEHNVLIIKLINYLQKNNMINFNINNEFSK